MTSSAFASAPSLAGSIFDAAPEQHPQAPAPAVGQPASTPARFDSFGTQYDYFSATPAARPQSGTGDVHSSIFIMPSLQSISSQQSIASTILLELWAVGACCVKLKGILVKALEASVMWDPSLNHCCEVVHRRLAACPSLSLPFMICAEPEDRSLAPADPLRQTSTVTPEPVRSPLQEEDLAEEGPLPVLQKAIVLFGMWSTLPSSRL